MTLLNLFQGTDRLVAAIWVVGVVVALAVLVGVCAVGYRLWRTRKASTDAVLDPGEEVSTLEAERAYRRQVKRRRKLERLRYRLPSPSSSFFPGLPWRTRRITRRHLKRARPVLGALLSEADPPDHPPKRLPRPGFYCDRKRLLG